MFKRYIISSCEMLNIKIKFFPKFYIKKFLVDISRNVDFFYNKFKNDEVQLILGQLNNNKKQHIQIK